MRIAKWLQIVFIALIIFWLPLTGRAQEDEPVLPVEKTHFGTVSGTIVNNSEGAGPPKSIDLMLHIWNQGVGEKPVIHVESREDGSFTFEEVDLLPGDWLTVMVLYEGVSYMVQPVEIQPGMDSVNIDLPVYETTSALSDVKIDQLQVFLFHDLNGLSISEVYVISNSGDRTVIGAEELDDGRPVTLRFDLQPGAENVSFNQDPGDRYLLFPEGFADTAPLVPGDQSTGIMLNYLVPYENEGTYSFTPKLPVGNVSFLTPAGSGLELSGERLEFSGLRPLRDGNTVDLYELSNLLPGETYNISVKSTAYIPALSSSVDNSTGINVFQSPVEISLVAGGAAFGIILVAAGIWLRRREEPQDVEEEA